MQGHAGAMQGSPRVGGGCMAPLIEPHLDGGLTALCPPHVRVLILAISTAYVSSETSDKLDNEQRRLAWPLRVWRILHLLRVWGGGFLTFFSGASCGLGLLVLVGPSCS